MITFSDTRVTDITQSHCYCPIKFLKQETYQWIRCIQFSFILLFVLISTELYPQVFFGQTYNPQALFKFELNASLCSDDCNFTEIGPSTPWGDGVSFCPNGNLYELTGGAIYQVDTLSGGSTLIFSPPPGPGIQDMEGFVCYEDSTFYSLDQFGNLYLYNILAGTVVLLGHTGINDVLEDLVLFEGEYYFSSYEGIIHLDISNPSNSYVIVPTPGYTISGLTASSICGTLLGINFSDDELVAINLFDGSITHVCFLPNNTNLIATFAEFSSSTSCDVYIDLDCNDSSGAMGSDYNSSNITCLDGSAGIADIDISLQYDAIIVEMTVQLNGLLPDSPWEFLETAGSIPGIDFSGAGTDLITLTNTGGAKSTDFKDALHLISYNNSAVYPTSGIRNVEVQFSTASGSMSNVATAFIPVIELPLINVDLGPDQIRCEGETVVFDAGNPGSMFDWLAGQSTQTISVTEAGEYSVTVSNGFACPNQDTVGLEMLPVIHIALTGDTETCDNEPANLTINTDAIFPLTIDISVDPGSPLQFTDVTGNYDFTVLPGMAGDLTTFTIINVVSSQPACIEITAPEHIIDVYATAATDVSVSLCEGDSIWLGYYWEMEAGEYENIFNTVEGCDSLVTTNISILPAVMIQLQADTCDPAAIGVFITTIDNPVGCDTVVTTTVSLIPTDTTLITQSTCVWSQSGTHTDTLTNQAGCDSLIINDVIYIPPADTTTLTEMTCDSSLLGTVYDTLSGMTGCDSIIERIVIYSLVDTTYISGTSCILAEIGVFETEYTDAEGCDSLVISTITQGTADTTRLFATSCDPASLGVFEELLLTSQGCDSLIITTVTYSAQDSTFITSATCDPASAGEFVTSYTNQFGCDSIVTETVTLNISHHIDLTSSSCNPADTGVFVQQLTNQFGCDSIVTETVSLLPSDQTQLSGTTCLSSEAGMFITTHLNQYGCDSIVTLTVSLVAADTIQFNFNTCDPAQTGSIETLFTGQDGCDSLVIQTTALYPLPVLIVESAIDYNGFDISCEGSTDGSAIANVNGVGPFTYLWSTDDTDQMITGLSAGDYDVAITDGNGCMTNGAVTLAEPDAFMIGFEVSEPDCFDQQLGSITVLPSGGVAPFTYSIDGTVFQASPVYTGLDEGIYQITSLDANDCSTTEIISIDVPLMVNVELGTNQSISIGDSTLLEAIINLPFDSLASVMWTGIDSIGCANCLTQIVAPIITTAYSVSVTSADGCADRDSMTVFVNTDYKIYIPNIFSPNGDGINDVIMISADESVREITSFSIFDRWGNLVFGADHFQPNDSSISWNGRMKGEAMNPGVFTFRLVVDFAYGHSEVRYGDITLVR